MDPLHFTLLRREKKYHGKIIDLTVDHLLYPSGTESIREIVEHPGGAVVVPLFDNNDILLVRQYRHPIGGPVIELPAGKLDRGEDPLLCAQRELREETGYRSESWNRITTVLTTPGFCNEMLHIFCAERIALSPHGQALEEGEASMTLLRTPFADALTMIDTGEIRDAKTIAGILMTAQRKGRQ